MKRELYARIAAIGIASLARQIRLTQFLVVSELRLSGMGLHHPWIERGVDDVEAGFESVRVCWRSV